MSFYVSKDDKGDGGSSYELEKEVVVRRGEPQILRTAQVAWQGRAVGHEGEEVIQVKLMEAVKRPPRLTRPPKLNMAAISLDAIFLPPSPLLPPSYPWTMLPPAFSP